MRSFRTTYASALFGPILAAAAPGGAPAAEVLEGPVGARVLAVVDGDTLDVRARIWLGQEVTARVRLDGIDAPELGGRCAEERRLADRARAFVRDRLGLEGVPPRVRLRGLRYGKFAGRGLARVETAAGEDLGTALVAAGLVRPYGGGRRRPWCPAGR